MQRYRLTHRADRNTRDFIGDRRDERLAAMAIGRADRRWIVRGGARRIVSIEERARLRGIAPVLLKRIIATFPIKHVHTARLAHAPLMCAVCARTHGSLMGTHARSTGRRRPLLAQS